MRTGSRQGFLHHASQCLMGLVQAQTTSHVVETLQSCLEGMPVLWHTLDLFEGERRRKRIASRRCPRGFEAFVSRFNLLRRQDGIYPGRFRNVLLLMVKATHPTVPDQFLICAVGLPRRSTLNEPASSACLGGLLHDALSRIFLLEALGRRAAVLDACAYLANSSVAVFDQRGAPVEWHPAEPPPAVLRRLSAHVRVSHARRRQAAAPPVLRGDDGEGFGESRHRWLAREPVLDNAYAVARITQPRADQPSIPQSLRTYGLSSRELEVAQLVFSGQTNRHIADALFISRDTVKTHCRRIFAKIGIARRTQMLRVLGPN